VKSCSTVFEQDFTDYKDEQDRIYLLIQFNRLACFVYKSCQSEKSVKKHLFQLLTKFRPANFSKTIRTIVV
jgi:hypothetical protein